ncbi:MULTISPECIES: LysE family translocator [unclassified Agarivorans]|uniref:LysE family translocator n=1 Tax=unclassified Agarivorans TaxID=2636026 RepID=UPI0026E41753|nr:MULTISPECIES: LysE family translocator [unclassified Agarivorans]MDO6685006.1 LysE family translocator [Agarivorans sp. 3_MG-2023]MDO6717436.1 LysE family translocator [Agarivorans sp. 2_MG-2023]
MEIIAPLISILGVMSLGIISPGPSFVLVARTAVANSRADGLATALGMGVGALFFAALALLGLQAVLLSVPTLYMVLKILGGAYLFYLAVVIWRGSKQTVDIVDGSGEKPSKVYQSFKIGLVTQLSNPKTAIFYGSVFAALLPADLSISLILLLALMLFILEAGWYSIVALALSSNTPRKVYLNLKTILDRVASFIIGGLGFKLIIRASSK